MTYTTVQGDKWDSIAYNMLGSVYAVDKLMAVNSKYIDIVVFPAGIVLELPELATVEKSNDLPPWKQVSG